MLNFWLARKKFQTKLMFLNNSVQYITRSVYSLRPKFKINFTINQHDSLTFHDSLHFLLGATVLLVNVR